MIADGGHRAPRMIYAYNCVRTCDAQIGFDIIGPEKIILLASFTLSDRLHPIDFTSKSCICIQIAVVLQQR